MARKPKGIAGLYRFGNSSFENLEAGDAEQSAQANHVNIFNSFSRLALKANHDNQFVDTNQNADSEENTMHASPTFNALRSSGISTDFDNFGSSVNNLAA